MAINGQQQAALYYARRRRASRSDPTRFFSLSANLGVLDAAVDTDAVLPARTAPTTITVEVTIEDVDTPNPTGVIIDLGGTANGLLLNLNSGALALAVGATAGAAGVDGVDPATYDVRGQKLRIMLVLVPATGVAECWVNGNKTIDLDGDPWTEWADDQDGAVGAAANGAANTRSASSSTAAPQNFSITQSVRVFYNQVPKAFG